MQYQKVRQRIEKSYPYYKEEIAEKMDDKDFYIDDVDDTTGIVTTKSISQVEFEMNDFLQGLEAKDDAEALYAENKYQCIALLDEPCGIYGD